VPRITVGTENRADIEIHYEDHGDGQPTRVMRRRYAAVQSSAAWTATGSRARRAERTA
jgi:hypothetical protein